MLRYIPNNVLEPYLKEIDDFYSVEGLIKWQALIASSEVKSALISLGYSLREIESLIESTRNSEAFLFRNWIERTPTLFEFLAENKLATFRDVNEVRAHRFFESFSNYISPVLSDSLLRFSHNDHQELVALFSYVCLLDEDHRATVEDQLFRGLKKELDALSGESFYIQNEQDLINRITPLLSEENIAIVNSLSKANYTLKLHFVDAILGAVRSIGCTPRFANWLLKQMDQLVLNQEHILKIRELRKDLQEGKLEVKNIARGRTPIRWRSILTIAVFLLLAGSVFYVIYFKPFSGPDEYNMDSKSSFTELTVKERKEIDSLIKQMNKEYRPEMVENDPAILSGGGSNLILRKSFTNQLMEQIYADLSLDAELAIISSDTCSKKEIAFKKYPGTLHLDGRTGGEQCFFKNESEYDVIVYVAEDLPSGNVYTLFVAKNASVTFRMEKNNVLTVVAGDNFSEYKAPKNTTGRTLPGSKYRHHFCYRDLNFEESINTSYQMISPRNSNKFVFAGNRGTAASLIDLTQSLQDY